MRCIRSRFSDLNSVGFWAICGGTPADRNHLREILIFLQFDNLPQWKVTAKIWGRSEIHPCPRLFGFLRHTLLMFFSEIIKKRWKDRNNFRWSFLWILTQSRDFQSWCRVEFISIITSQLALHVCFIVWDRRPWSHGSHRKQSTAKILTYRPPSRNCPPPFSTEKFMHRSPLICNNFMYILVIKSASPLLQEGLGSKHPWVIGQVLRYYCRQIDVNALQHYKKRTCLHHTIFQSRLSYRYMSHWIYHSFLDSLHWHSDAQFRPNPSPAHSVNTKKHKQVFHNFQ